MRAYDNQNRLVGEINTTFLQDGSVVTSNTVYDPHNGQAISQHISVRNAQGEGHNEEHIWWKVAAVGSTHAL